MTTIDKIRAEIKKLQDIFVETAQGMETEDEATVYSMCAVEFGDELLDLLDTLEKPRCLMISDGWKPTEEQMEALQRAIDACESEWAYQDDELRSLLNDLKKL